jgi:hypothetical protein
MMGVGNYSYSAFTNWEFWWPAFPVLVYFKETQTKPEGQIHFFPIISVSSISSNLSSHLHFPLSKVES